MKSANQAVHLTPRTAVVCQAILVAAQVTFIVIRLMYPKFLNGEKMKKIFDGKKTTKLGTEKNPAIVSV